MIQMFRKSNWSAMLKIVGIVFLIVVSCNTGYAQSRQQSSGESRQQQRLKNNKLSKAVREGNEQEINQALSEGADPSVGLFAAVRLKNQQIVDLLISKGARPDSGLFAAVSYNDVAMIDYFLSKGARPDSGLFAAITRKNVKMVKLMLGKGAVPNSQHISAAEKRGNEEIKALLTNWKGGGSQPSASTQQSAPTQQNVSAQPGRSRPAGSGPKTIGNAIRRGDVEKSKDVDPDSGLRSAISRKDVKMVELMLSKGADPNRGLYSAILNKDVKIVELLLSKGAKPNNGLYPAIRSQNVKMVEFLLSKGADPSEGLRSAKRLKNDQMIALCRKHGALDRDELRKLSQGIPSDYAEQKDYARFLMQKRLTKKFEEFIRNDNCRLNSREDYEEMLTYAAGTGCLDIAKFLWPLLPPKMNFSGAYFSAIAQGNNEFFNYLVAQKAPINWREYGAEAVVLAAAGGSVEIMDSLKRAGCPLDNVVNMRRLRLACSPYHHLSMAYQSYTALSVAAYKGNLKIVKYLVENGADVNRVYKAYSSTCDALMCAANGGQTEVCRYLISKGANPNYVSGNLENSVLIARNAGFTQCAEALIKAGGVSSKFDLKKLANQQEAKRLAAEEELKKKKAAAAAARRQKFLSSLDGVEKAAAEVIIRNLDRDKQIASKSLFGALTSDIDSEVVAITLTKEKMFGNVYVGYYTLRVTGGLSEISHKMAEAFGGKEAAEDNKNQKVKIRVTYDGKKCLVDAFIVVDKEGNTNRVHWQ